MAKEQNDKDSSTEDESTKASALKSESTTGEETPLEASDSDALDPELIKLPRPSTRIRPIMAIAIVLICIVLIVRLWDDLQFSRQGEMVVVDSIADLSEDLVESYVEIEATPDRQQAIRLLPSRKTTGPILMPIIGHNKDLWIVVHPTPWTEDIRTDERYQGRLSRISDQSFYDPIREYYNSKTIVARPIAIEEVRKSLSAKSPRILDLAGESFEISANNTVRFLERSTSKVRVIANAGANYINEETWRIALENAGLFEGANPIDRTAVSHTTDSWTFELPLRSGIVEIEEMLTSARLFAAKAEEIVATRTGTWAELSLDGDEVVMGKAKPGFELKSIALGLAMEINADTYVLNTTENPQTYWYMLALVLFLAAIAAIFIFGIVATLRRI